MDILARLYLPDKREYLQLLGECLREKLGKDVIVNAFRKDIERDRAEILVIDGIRYWNEVELLRSFENNVLIFVTAPSEIRYNRCTKRGEKGEARITYEEFLKAEERETERRIDEIGKKADYILENTGTKEELIGKVEEIIKKGIKWQKLRR
jgi:dephospho-CoA kinase